MGAYLQLGIIKLLVDAGQDVHPTPVQGPRSRTASETGRRTSPSGTYQRLRSGWTVHSAPGVSETRPTGGASGQSKPRSRSKAFLKQKKSFPSQHIQ